MSSITLACDAKTLARSFRVVKDQCDLSLCKTVSSRTTASELLASTSHDVGG